MIAELSKPEMEELLIRQVVARLACHADGETYVVPISYAYDGKFFYCHSLEGRKLEMMRKNPRVCLLVDELKSMGEWKSVIAWGKFEELSKKDEIVQAFQLLLKRKLPVNSSVTTHLGSQWPFSSDELEEVGGVFFRILIGEKSGRFEENVSSPDIPG